MSDVKMSETTYFAVGDHAAHDGFTTSRAGPAWPAEGGWTYQDVAGPHGNVIYEGASEADAVAALNAFLVCDAPTTGAYCYTHNPSGR